MSLHFRVMVCADCLAMTSKTTTLPLQSWRHNASPKVCHTSDTCDMEQKSQCKLEDTLIQKEVQSTVRLHKSHEQNPNHHNRYSRQRRDIDEVSAPKSLIYFPFIILCILNIIVIGHECRSWASHFIVTSFMSFIHR